MADIKISQLGAAIAVSGSDLLPIVSNGSTLKAPASLVKEYAVGNTDLSGIGDGTPTGAISALNTAKQPKTLDTPLTIGDVQKTTVEAALGGLNSESQSLRQALTTLECLVLSTGSTAVSALPYTFTNPDIETDMVCLKAVLGDPSAQLGDWTVNTDTAGSAVVSGTLSVSTTITLYMMKSR